MVVALSVISSVLFVAWSVAIVSLHKAGKSLEKMKELFFDMQVRKAHADGESRRFQAENKVLRSVASAKTVPVREKRIKELALTWIENGNHENYSGNQEWVCEMIVRDAANTIDAIDKAKVPCKEER
jgi:hypothetical protein